MTALEIIKDFFFLALGSAIVGFACFAIQYWLINDDYPTLLSTAITVGITGFITAILEPYIRKWCKKRKSRTE